MKSGKKNVNLQVDESIHEKLKVMAALEGRSMASVLTEMVLRYAEERKVQEKLAS